MRVYALYEHLKRREDLLGRLEGGLAHGKQQLLHVSAKQLQAVMQLTRLASTRV